MCGENVGKGIERDSYVFLQDVPFPVATGFLSFLHVLHDIDENSSKITKLPHLRLQFSISTHTNIRSRALGALIQQIRWIR